MPNLKRTGQLRRHRVERGEESRVDGCGHAGTVGFIEKFEQVVEKGLRIGQGCEALPSKRTGVEPPGQVRGDWYPTQLPLLGLPPQRLPVQVGLLRTVANPLGAERLVPPTVIASDRMKSDQRRPSRWGPDRSVEHSTERSVEPHGVDEVGHCLLYTSPSPRDA